VIWFGGWLIINIGWIPGIVPFDPFPFGLLTTIVSLEAIFLAIIVLISQNRGSNISEIREEVDLQMDVITEHELTKSIEMLALLLEKNGIDFSQDKELHRMLKPTNLQKIEQALEKEIV
jgi:uncharacterized membrane protein